MSRTPAAATLVLAALPALTGCSMPQSTQVGTSLSISRPVGAYEHEFRRGNNADVHYLVENLVRSDPGKVDFDLTVTVPQLGRPYGFRDMVVTCVSGGETSTAESSEEFLNEQFEGVYDFPMWCDLPEGSADLSIEVDHFDELLRFQGSLD
jgi:hypothetical protein